MADSGVAKVQHYVPQFLLRNFGVGKKDQLNVFDKKTGKNFKTNCKNVACESRFYDFEFQDKHFSLEPSLSNIESLTRPILKGITDKESLNHLSLEDRANISIFLSIQFTRTKHFREKFSQMPAMLAKALKIKGYKDEQLTEITDYLTKPSDNEASLMNVRMIHQAPKDFSIHFANKVWLLAKTASNSDFIIGDNPISLDNQLDLKPYGNLGLAVKGIEINFPLSPKLALLLWCPSVLDYFFDAQKKYEILGINSPNVITSTIEAVNSGQPLLFSDENVVNFNSRQIFYAERYVFSNRDDFSLAKEMVSSDSRLKYGPRMEMA